MSTDYGIPTLMKFEVGSWINFKKVCSSLYTLKQPDGVQVQLVFECGVDTSSWYRPTGLYHTANNSRPYTWKVIVADFNRSSTISLEVKASMQDRGAFRYYLREEWSEPHTLNRSNREAVFTHPIRTEVVNWPDLDFCVEVRPLIEKPVVGHSKSRLLDNLTDAFKNEKCANVTIKAGDQTFKVSEFMLRTQSEVFDAMFAHETEEQKTKVITIQNASLKIVKRMLEFMYTEKVEDLKSVAAELLPLAAQYQLSELCDMCANEMCGDLKVETIIDQLELVALYDHLTDFKIRVLEFTKKNLEEICKLPGWDEFGKKNVEIVMEILATSVEV